MKFRCPFACASAVAAVCLGASPAWAQESTIARASGWSWEPFVVVPLALAAALYVLGLHRMWRRSPANVRWLQVASFAAGWLSLVAALDSPIDHISEQLFWVHMTQHEILMLVAPPLLVMSRPLAVFVWALPPAWRDTAGSIVKWRPVAALWVLLSTALVAWLLHAAALWAWHAPSLFDAALENGAVHALQHACFFGTALLFWWTLIHGRHGRLGYGSAIVYVFTTAAHNSILGALLTFAPHAWYAPYASTTAAWGLSPIQDQQVGGLIMWVPAGTLLVIIGVAMLAAWMGESERRFQYTRMAALMRQPAGGNHAD